MNARIDMDPDSCPWVRVDGIKTMFVLKHHQSVGGRERTATME
jgi:hypothetical protein